MKQFTKLLGAVYLSLSLGYTSAAAEAVTDTTGAVPAVTATAPTGVEIDSAGLAAGKQLFTTRCKSCHAPAMRLTGPALGDVIGRRSPEWIYKFVRSSQSLIKSGDADAITVFNEYNQVLMPDQTDLTDQDIDGILAYTEAEAKLAAANAGKIKRPAEVFPAYKPLYFNDAAGWTVIGLINAFLLLGLYFVVRIKERV